MQEGIVDSVACPMLDQVISKSIHYHLAPKCFSSNLSTKKNTTRRNSKKNVANKKQKGEEERSI